jgi:hypothetical protein
MVSLALLEAGSIFLTRSLLSSSGVELPALFAVAFALSMPLRRAVLPKLAVALPMATLVHRLAPSLAKVHVSNVWRGREQWMPAWAIRWIARWTTPSAPSESAAATGVAASAAPPSPRVSLSRLPAFLSSLSDRFGLSLILSYRVAGCVLVHAVYLALSRGVDLDPLLQLCDVTADLRAPSVIGAHAGAVVYSALWFPVTVFLAPYPAKLLWRLHTHFRERAPTK